MARRRQLDFTAQQHVAQNLSVPARGEENYDITEYQVEEWETGHLLVKRARVPKHAPGITYREAFVVGVRGSRKTLYSTLYT